MSALPVPLTLAEIGKRLRQLTRDHEIEVSFEVVKLSENWEMYRKEAGGLEINKWLQREVHATRRLSWYKSRALAGTRAGSAGKYFASKALLWLSNNATDELVFKRCLAVARDHYKAQNSKPLELSQTCKLFPKLATKPRPREDQLKKLLARIARLEGQVRRLGEEPVA